MNYGDARRLVTKTMLDHPIPADRAYAADGDAEEAARVREWVTKSMATGSSDAPATTSVEATCDLVVAIVTSIIENLQRHISELTARAKLSEDRCRALEKRAVRVEERTAKVEERQLGPVDRLSISPQPKAH